VRFIATAEHVAGHLRGIPQLEWSPAVVDLCKAFEIEIVNRILRPVPDRVSDKDLSNDKTDKDFREVAVFCIDRRKPPALGTFAHFLQTVINSQQRRDASPLVATFLRLLAEWSGSNWLLDSDGLYRTLTSLTKDYRNRATHIDELSLDDYARCRELVIPRKLVVATTES
jgi:hypothetical protein